MFIFIFISIVISSCSSNDYDKLKDSFYDKYFKITESVDFYDINKSSKSLNTDENVNEIKKLKAILADVKNKVPQNRKAEYEKMCEWLDGLVLLQSADDKWESLTIGERSRLYSE